MERPRSQRTIWRIRQALNRGMTHADICRQFHVGFDLVARVACGEFEIDTRLRRLGIPRGTVAKCGCGRKVIDDGFHVCRACRVLKQRGVEWQPRPGDDPDLRLELDGEELARLEEIKKERMAS